MARVAIDLCHVPREDKPILRNLLELYRYDYSEFSGEDVGPYGIFGYTHLDHYWTEPGRCPFIIRINSQLARFVLVRAAAADGEHFTSNIAEFFILRKYRRQEVGQTIAQQIFDQFPGSWEVSQEHHKLPAQAFCRKVIARYTGGNFTDEQEGDPPRMVQQFQSKGLIPTNRQ